MVSGLTLPDLFLALKLRLHAAEADGVSSDFAWSVSSIEVETPRG